MDTGIQKSKYHWGDVSCSINIKVNGGNISIVYTMVAYKSKMIHHEDDTLHLFTMRQNSNAYPREEKSCGDDSIIFIPDDRHVGDAVIAENTYHSSNKIYEIICSVLSSIHIGGAK